MAGCGETYLSALGVFLKALPIQVGALAALPSLVSSFCQLAGVWLLEWLHRRREILVVSALIQAILWVLIGLLGIVLGPGVQSVNVLMALVCVYFSLTGINGPVWNSLIGDIVPAEARGRYFGRRGKFAGLATLLSLILAGQILHLFERCADAAYGFLVICVCAFLARLMCVYWLSRHEDPPFKIARADYFSFFQFLRRMPHSNFARFVLFVGLTNFAINFAGPYFSLYMLRELRLSYFEYTSLVAAAVITQFLTLQHWGNIADRFGNKKILNVSSYGIALNGFLWLFSADVWYLLLVQLYSGFVWAGFNLAVGNFLFDAVTPPKRARCVAYQAIISGLFIFGGSLLGGYVAAHPPAFVGRAVLPLIEDSPYLYVFFVSGVLRLLAALLFLPRFSEVRDVEAIGHHDLIFRIVHLRPVSGATFSPLSIEKE